jgi:peptidoglycan/LPS O-acetylase OafA/YrhL
MTERIHSLDTLRGAGVIGLVFLHGVVYYYANIDSVDFENPPVFIAIIGLMVLWGGMFAIVSGCVNTYRYERRTSGVEQVTWNPRRRLILAGVALLVLHVFYNAVAAPTSFDFDTGVHKYGIVADLLRNGSINLSATRIVEGTSLLMLGLNLIVLALLLPILSRSKRPVLLACVFAAVFMASGLLRFVFLPIYQSLVERGEYVLAFLLSPLAAKPYPVLPYVAFGMAGSAFGFTLARHRRAPRFAWLAGVALMVAGALGVVFLPTDLVGADLFWYSKVYLELGVFVLITWAVLRISGAGKPTHHIVQRVGRMSLTVFLIQTPLAELLAAAMTVVYPGWNDTIPAVVIFGLANAIVWLAIVAVWSRWPNATVEGLWVLVFRGSTKLRGV